MEYKVLKDEGVTVDGVDFAKDEIIDLEADSFNVPELLADGSIVEATADEEAELGSEDEEEEAPEPEPTDEEAEAPAEEAEKVLLYNGKKIVGEVTDNETEGVMYKCFSTEDGQTFKLTEAEFAESVA